MAQGRTSRNARIIREWRTGKFTKTDLARKHGLSASVISRITLLADTEQIEIMPEGGQALEGWERRVIGDYRKGLSMVAISRRRGAPLAHIGRVIHAHGVEIKNVVSKRNERIVRDWREGVSRAHIAEKYGMSQRDVYLALYMRGVRDIPRPERKQNEPDAA